MDSDGAGVDIDDPDGPAAGVEVFPNLLRNFSRGIAVGQDFHGQVGRAVVEPAGEFRLVQAPRVETKEMSGIREVAGESGTVT